METYCLTVRLNGEVTELEVPAKSYGEAVQKAFKSYPGVEILPPGGGTLVKYEDEDLTYEDV